MFFQTELSTLLNFFILLMGDGRISGNLCINQRPVGLRINPQNYNFLCCWHWGWGCQGTCSAGTFQVSHVSKRSSPFTRHSVLALEHPCVSCIQAGLLMLETPVLSLWDQGKPILSTQKLNEVPDGQSLFSGKDAISLITCFMPGTAAGLGSGPGKYQS